LSAKPCGEDGAERGRIGRIEAKQLAVIPKKIRLRGFAPGSKVDVGRPRIGPEPKMRNAGRGHHELVAGGCSELRKALQRSLPVRQELPLLQSTKQNF